MALRICPTCDTYYLAGDLCPKCGPQAPIPPVDLTQRVTLSGAPPAPGCEGLGAPQPINPKTGMHADYWVLSEAERAKGFVRPVRRSYVHVGVRPKCPMRDPTPEEAIRYGEFGYVKFEESDASNLGRYWTAEQLKSGCGSVTTMSTALAETYARCPTYYGATFCCVCVKHLPVGEFVWDGVSPEERVGS